MTLPLQRRSCPVGAVVQLPKEPIQSRFQIINNTQRSQWDVPKMSDGNLEVSSSTHESGKICRKGQVKLGIPIRLQNHCV
jgi:hypothetical protein